MEPFKAAIAEASIKDLQQRLSLTRFADAQHNPDWRYGVDLDYLKEFCNYWQHNYDWRKTEAELNRFEQMTTIIDDLRIHFIHARSKHSNARPLIITHGWPGSVLEFMDVIEPLIDPLKHGGTEEDAFHVVCPSMPGYGFSQAPSKGGTTPKVIAAIHVELMSRLGYKDYIAQGGDWGSMVSTEMAKLDAKNCAGLHLNMLVAFPPADSKNPNDALSPEEAYNVQNSEDFTKEGMGYYHLQSTKPQTVSYALTDSPVGQAAWILEKFRDWSDCGGDVESSYSKDALLGNISLYWFTATAGSSARLYYETVHGDMNFDYVEVPTGAALFPKELVKAPKSWAEVSYNIVHWQSYDRGGHFAAMEVSDLWIKDVRLFNKAL